MELRFKKSGEEKYAGINVAGDNVVRIGNDKEPDNILCHSEKFIGIVDGESPVADKVALSPLFFAYLVANSAFMNKPDGLLEGKVVAVEDLAKVKTAFQKAFEAGLKEGKKRYNDALERIADPYYHALAKEVPKWQDILNELDATAKKEGSTLVAQFDKYAKLTTPINPTIHEGYRLLENRRNDVDRSVERFNAEVLDTFKAKISQAKDQYLNKITLFKRKMNSGVAVVAARLSNFEERSLKSLGAKQAKTVLHGSQIGRSWVAVLGLHEFTKTGDKAKYFNYRLKKYQQHYSWDLTRVYPEVSQVPKRGNQDNVKHFEFPVEKGDIVILTDSTLVDNFSYLFIEHLINLAAFKLFQDPKWSPEGSQDVKAAVESYFHRMNQPQAIKHALFKVTGNSNFKAFTDNVVEDSKEELHTDFQKCGLFSFFPALANLGQKTKSLFGTTNCVRNVGRKSYFYSAELKASGDYAKNFDPVRVSQTLSIANKMIKELAAAAFTRPDPAVFINYKTIIGWKQDVDMVKASAKNKAAQGPVTVSPNTLTTADFDAMIANRQFGPSDGDLTVFTNILVEGQADDEKMVCTEPEDKVGAKMADNLKLFAAKTSGVVSEEQIEDFGIIGKDETELVLDQEERRLIL